MIWEGSIRVEKSDFFACMSRCLEVSLRAMRPTSSDAKLMGGGWTRSCRPLHFAQLKAFCCILRRSGVIIPLHFLSTL